MDDDNDLMCALHDIFEAVETQKKCSAQQALERLMEMLELVADERGAFREDAAGEV